MKHSDKVLCKYKNKAKQYKTERREKNIKQQG